MAGLQGGVMSYAMALVVPTWQVRSIYHAQTPRILNVRERRSGSRRSLGPSRWLL